MPPSAQPPLASLGIASNLCRALSTRLPSVFTDGCGVCSESDEESEALDSDSEPEVVSPAPAAKPPVKPPVAWGLSPCNR
jgi:hypothetical protein